MGKHNEFGKEGEKLAVDFLVKKGYEIRYENYRYLKAEIDIIAQKKDILAIVEVRARSNDQIIPIAETITPKKIKLLVMAADHYVTENQLDLEVRFDVVTILKNRKVFKIEHLESAFYHFWYFKLDFRMLNLKVICSIYNNMLFSFINQPNQNINEDYFLCRRAVY